MSKPTKKLKTLLILSAMLAAGSGCTKQAIVPQHSDPVVEAIRQAVDKIQADHSMLAAVERGQKPLKLHDAKPSDVPELSHIINIRNWNGPVDELLSTMAVLVGYSFEHSGLKPAIQPVVILDADNIEFYDALTAISDQSSDRFDIRFNVPEKKLIVVYGS